MAETENAPSTISGNPFSLIAYLLFKVRHSLEDVEEPNRPPRWVRIARARGAQGPIATGVQAAVNGLSDVVWYMADLGLRIQDVLQQTDAAKALAEVSIDFLRAATSPSFTEGISALTGLQLGGTPIEGVNDTLLKIKQHLDYIPDPDDVRVVGHELYRLLCLEQLPLPRTAAGAVDEARVDPLVHLDWQKSGKMTLMQLAFSQALSVQVAGGTVDLTRYGARRVWKAADPARLPTRSQVRWKANAEAQVDLTIEGNRDLEETHTLLERLGYTDPAATGAARTSFSAELIRRLRRFQVINGLPLTGALDNATLNALLNLDFGAKNLRRAKAFDAAALPAWVDQVEATGAPALPAGYFPLVNPSADSPEAEGVTVQTKAGFPRYRYYVVGAPLPATGSAPVPAGGGWISDAGPGVVPGFVALQSRMRSADEGRNEGGFLSEGEASNGTFFFVARFTEPWIAGREGLPGEDALFSPQGVPALPAGSVSRIYQWIPLGFLTRPEGWELSVTASCLRRSLYEERSGTAGVPDQGTLAVEFYDAAYFTGNRGTRRDPTKALAVREAPRFPDQAAAAQALTLSEVARRRVWTRQEVTDVPVPAGAAAMLVILQGHYQAGYDIDAYFDDVQVSWQFRKQTA
jgi:hypothetical protein